MERDEARTGAENKEEGGEVEKRRRRRKAGERMERSEETDRSKGKREGERRRTREECRTEGFAAGIIGVSSLPTGHNGPSRGE